MDCVSEVNLALKAGLNASGRSVVYGQNVNAGSRLGGLTKDFASVPGCRVVNTPNVENSLVGMGFGLMLGGVTSLYAIKQQDFLLLGLDQLVNTWSALRSRGPFVPFVLAMIVVDSGWEGPQASFNNTIGIASLARIPAFLATSAHDIGPAVSRAFEGGPAILALSQRMLKKEPAVTTTLGTTVSVFDSYTTYQTDDTLEPRNRLLIICVNFSFEHALALQDELAGTGTNVSIVNFFSVVREVDSRLIEFVSVSDVVLVLDDSKAESGLGHLLVSEIVRHCPAARVTLHTRRDHGDWNLPRADTFTFEISTIMSMLMS